jgi:ribosomal protein L32
MCSAGGQAKPLGLAAFNFKNKSGASAISHRICPDSRISTIENMGVKKMAPQWGPF